MLTRIEKLIIILYGIDHTHSSYPLPSLTDLLTAVAAATRSIRAQVNERDLDRDSSASWTRAAPSVEWTLERTFEGCLCTLVFLRDAVRKLQTTADRGVEQLRTQRRELDVANSKIADEQRQKEVYRMNWAHAKMRCDELEDWLEQAGKSEA